MLTASKLLPCARRGPCPASSHSPQSEDVEAQGAGPLVQGHTGSQRHRGPGSWVCLGSKGQCFPPPVPTSQPTALGSCKSSPRPRKGM